MLIFFKIELSYEMYDQFYELDRIELSSYFDSDKEVLLKDGIQFDVKEIFEESIYDLKFKNSK